MLPLSSTSPPTISPDSHPLRHRCLNKTVDAMGTSVSRVLAIISAGEEREKALREYAGKVRAGCRGPGHGAVRMAICDGVYCFRCAPSPISTWTASKKRQSAKLLPSPAQKVSRRAARTKACQAETRGTMQRAGGKAGQRRVRQTRRVASEEMCKPSRRRPGRVVIRNMTRDVARNMKRRTGGCGATVSAARQGTGKRMCALPSRHARSRQALSRLLFRKRFPVRKQGRESACARRAPAPRRASCAVPCFWHSDRK